MAPTVEQVVIETPYGKFAGWLTDGRQLDTYRMNDGRSTINISGFEVIGINVRLSLDKKGSWRTRYSRVNTLSSDRRGMRYPWPLDHDDPLRKEIASTVREAVEQWWVTNRVERSREALTAREAELTELIEKEECLLQRRRDELASVRSELERLPPTLAELEAISSDGPGALESVIASALEVDE